jgi:spore coat polysaccharide biosynthesis predicted glycosyltransferase SpsG/CMP-N-acetylneuraminic acid synthetase
MADCRVSRFKRHDCLIVIPAPLHGDRLPRKMLRLLHGRPLLMHAVDIALEVVQSPLQVVVVTNDDEVAALAEREGCGAVLDEKGWDQDGSIRQGLIFDLLVRQEAVRERAFQAVLLLYPSAPLLKPVDLEQAVAMAMEGEYESVISACESAHHTWMKVNGGYIPDFGLQSAQAENQLYRETGGFIVSRRDAIWADRFVGRRVGLALVPQERAIDILSPEEWWICERLLRRKRLVFVVAGNRCVGMGHIYRALQLAQEINNHEVIFVCTADSDLAAKMFAENRYTTVVQGEESLSEVVVRQAPDLVINDFLNTDAEYVRALRAIGAKVINFEDMGSGTAEADLVINALYWEPSPKANHRVGPDYFSIREEFLQVPPGRFRPDVQEVLVTFGGVDEADLTSRVLRVIGPEALRRKIRLSIVTGTGYGHAAGLAEQIRRTDSPLVVQANGTKRMSEYMSRADIAFSSAGRTLFELAMMRVPTIVMACNAREETHPFASSHSGFQYLGRHDQVSDEMVLSAFRRLLDQSEQRRLMRKDLERFDFRDSKRRVMEEITKVLGVPLS